MQFIIEPDDLACICFTCGTSGEPRGAMLTHAVSVYMMNDMYYSINAY